MQIGKLHTSSFAVVLLILGANAVSAGILTGKVTNPNNVGVANVKVDFYESSTGNQVVVTGNLTDAGGNYGVLVPNGTYDVEFVTPVLTGGIVPIRYTALSVNTTVTLNVSRPFGVVLGGTVFDTLAIPVSGVDLNVIDALTGALEFTPNDNTGGSGNYDVILLPGLKNLVYSDQNAGSRLAPVSMQNINLTADMTIDVNLPAGVIVSGTVLDAALQPVVGADLDFDVSSTELRLTTPNDNTDNNGVYQVVVPTGVFNITVEPAIADRLVAKRIFSIPVNHDTTVDFSLQAGLSLSGTVSGPGGAVNGCDIDVIDTLTLAKLVTPGDKTDAAGFYEVIVPSGNFELHFQPPVSSNLASLIKPGVHVGQDTVVNATVQSGVLLQGTVQSSSGGLVDACDIDLFNSSTQASVLAAGDRTNFNGNYQMIVLTGTYDLEFEAPKIRRLQAKRLTGQVVGAPQTLNVTLDTGLSVSGVITGNSSPVVNVNVDAIIESSGLSTFQPGDQSNASGAYEIIIGFVPHTLAFFPPVATGFAARKYTGINPGTNLVHNVTLSTGFLINGTATQVGGSPVSGVTLRAEASGSWVPTSEGVSDGAGQYQTRLGAGSYRLVYTRTVGLQTDSVVMNPVAISKDTVINVEFAPTACACPCWADPQCDGVRSNVQDVVGTVNVAFRGSPGVFDSGCAFERSDVNASGFTNVQDVVAVVNVAFRGASATSTFVNPCGP